MILSTAIMWTLTVLFEKPLISVGLNFLFVIPGILAGATSVWFLYPYCYSRYLVSCSLHEFSASGTDAAFQLFPFLFCAVLIFVLAVLLSARQFGKKK